MWGVRAACPSHTHPELCCNHLVTNPGPQLPFWGNIYLPERVGIAGLTPAHNHASPTPLSICTSHLSPNLPLVEEFLDSIHKTTMLPF